MNDRLYYYDFDQECIKTGHAKSLNTKKGYYSTELEEYLNHEIEAPLGEVLKGVIGFCQEPLYQLTINPKSLEIIKKYAYACIFRGEEFHKRVASHSAFARLFPEQHLHDFSVATGIQQIPTERLLKGFIMGFAVNRTKLPFFLPLVGLYELPSPSGICLVLPLSPEVAIVFLDGNAKEMMFNIHEEDMNPIIFELEDKKLVDAFNKWAFKGEERLNKRMIISNNRKALQHLIKEVL